MTALTRGDSQSKLPDGVITKKIDYNQPETLVEALRGQDALIITLSAGSPKETEKQLIEAAGEAGVAWIMPNEWCPDTANEALVKDVFVFQSRGKQFRHFCIVKISVLIAGHRATSADPQSHRRPWQDLLHLPLNWVLVRVESIDTCGLRH